MSRCLDIAGDSASTLVAVLVVACWIVGAVGGATDVVRTARRADGPWTVARVALTASMVAAMLLWPIWLSMRGSTWLARL